MNNKLPPFEKYNQTLIRFDRKKPSRSQRKYFFLLIVLSLFALLIIRLFQLTVVKGAYYRSVANDNRIREVTLEAPRGTIKDRKGFTIAYSDADVSGVHNRRLYNAPDAAAHIIGYIQIADTKDIAGDTCSPRLKSGYYVGKSGVEKLFECRLRGTPGKKLVEVNAQGKERHILNQIEPQSGEDVQLALDLELQKKTYDILANITIENSGGVAHLSEKRAAIVVTNPKTGEILTLVSTPSFNPHVFSENQRSEIERYFTDENHPLFNRALTGTYPPGSTFKMIVASGALEEDAIDNSYTITDTGTIDAGPIKFGNWYFLQYGRTEGEVDILKSLQRSNDIYYYKVGEKMGREAIKNWASKFGLGKKTGIGLPEESGLIPTAFWKEESLNDRWFLGDTYNLSIGQGYLLTTPIQMNQATGVFANGGKLCAPQLEKIDPSGQVRASCVSLGLSQQTLLTIREGMKMACESGGTGWPFFQFRVKKNSGDTASGALGTTIISGNDPTDGEGDTPELAQMRVGCKTGTSESHGVDTLPHAWFTAFAPFDDPEILITVMVENGGEGSSVAAPIAKEILRTYFERSE